MTQHKHKVNETKSRSVTKAVFGRIIEVIVGGFVFGTILTILGFQHAYVIGFGLNMLEEIICFFVTVFTERVWNRIDWGREVEDVEE